MQAKTAIAIRKEEAKPSACVNDALPIGGRRGERVMEVCEAMIDVCAALYGVSSKEIRQTCKSTPDIVRVRQIAMYVTHVALGVTMQEVGRCFARDRTTVRYACCVIEDLRDDDDFDRTIATTERVAHAAFRNRLES
ncbi:helix-turn-helix domain-containing protein [Mesorhizobium sp. IMUNJ 23232]|uniref:helix-turn-helix domain-containing protein n=1 Tax=Mesorhizobium sp. IMUNJ 23232 TaxID=3376064 RepID=UPI0037B0060F